MCKDCNDNNIHLQDGRVLTKQYDKDFHVWLKKTNNCYVKRTRYDQLYKKYIRSILGDEIEFVSYNGYLKPCIGTKPSSVDQLYEQYQKDSGETPDGEAQKKFEELFGKYGDWELVGHGRVTNDKCGRFSGFRGCVKTWLHNKVSLLDKGFNFKDRVYVKLRHHSCDNPRCPTCYNYGWAVREARNIEARIREAQKTFGIAEHIVISVPDADYGLTYDQLRQKAVKIAQKRGVIGGCLIFHGFRYRVSENINNGIRNMSEWYWSPHWHIIGFLKVSYNQCRNCTKATYTKTFRKRKTRTYTYHGNAKVCAGCSGFEARTRLQFKDDGYIAKVEESRQTIGGTAWYQLNHASINTKIKRFHVATWFGVCSYKKLKVTPQTFKELCPICQSELTGVEYIGRITDFELERKSPFYYKDFYPFMIDETGMQRWAEKPEWQK